MGEEISYSGEVALEIQCGVCGAELSVNIEANSDYHVIEVSGCPACDAESDAKEYSRGHDEGFEEGEGSVNEASYKKGLVVGYHEGHAAALREVMEAGGE